MKKVIDTFLKNVQPLIDDVIKQRKEKNESEGLKYTKFDENFDTIVMTYDLLKSLEKYTSPEDELIKFTAKVDRGIKITIDSIISRNGVEYPFWTDVIYAGGYNIQVLHFRYLVKTKLPKTNENKLTNEFKSKVQKFAKAEKIKNLIKGYKKNIESESVKLENALKIQQDPDSLKIAALGRSSYKIPTWDGLNHLAKQNYDNDENKFKASWEQHKADSIRLWININIESRKDSIDAWKKEIKKLETKLNAL